MTFTATPAAIETAARNAQRDAANYTISGPDDIFTEMFTIRNAKSGARYLVTVGAQGAYRCSCPQFDTAHVCKHMKLVDDHRALLAAEEADQSRHDCEAGKF